MKEIRYLLGIELFMRLSMKAEFYNLLNEIKDSAETFRRFL